MLWAVAVCQILNMQPAPEAPRRAEPAPADVVHTRENEKHAPQFLVDPECTVSINILHTPGELNKQPVVVSTRNLSVQLSVQQTSDHAAATRQTSAVATIEEVLDWQGQSVLGAPRELVKPLRDSPGSGFQPSYEAGRPTSFRWSAHASLTSVPERFSVIRGFAEVEVAESVSIKDVRVELGSQVAEVVPGVTATVNLAPGEKDRRRFGAEVVVAPGVAPADFAIMSVTVLDATDFSVVASKQSSELRISHDRRSDGSQAYTLRADRIPASGPLLLRLEVVSNLRVVRIPFEFKDVSGSD